MKKLKRWRLDRMVGHVATFYNDTILRKLDIEYEIRPRLTVGDGG
jgi:hypothetical protein